MVILEETWGFKRNAVLTIGISALWRFLNKVRLELSWGPAMLLLGIYTKELKPGSERNIVSTLMFTANLVTIAHM